MGQLEEIFAIPDPQKRMEQLLALARSLRINVAKIKNDKGEPDENKLAVLLFEELREGKQKKRQQVMLIVLAVVLFIFGTIAMYALSQLVMTMTASQRAPVFDAEE
jgi:ABC-type Na+ efflux pump permease subunit